MEEEKNSLFFTKMGGGEYPHTKLFPVFSWWLFYFKKNDLYALKLEKNTITFFSELWPPPPPIPHYYGELAQLQQNPLHINYLSIPSLKTNTMQKSI